MLSAGNRELLDVIAARRPRSIQELAEMTGRKKSNLSRTLRTMALYGIVHLEKGEHGRVAPIVAYDRLTLDLPLIKPLLVRQ